MGLALLTVMLVTPVVLTNLRTCFLVFTCVGLTLVSTVFFFSVKLIFLSVFFMIFLLLANNNISY